MSANRQQVFISHIHEEAVLGGVIKSCIEDTFRGHRVTAFLSSDLQDLPSGLKWLDVIENQLNRSAVVVSILSPTALARPWVNIELGAGWIKRLRIIPLCHSMQRVTDLPRPFSDFNGVGLDQADAAERLLGGIADALGLEHPRRLAFKEILGELRAAAASIAANGSRGLTSAAGLPVALELPPEQTKILQLLAKHLDLSSDDDAVPIETIAEVTGIRRSVLLHHVEKLDDSGLVYSSYYGTGQHVRLTPEGSGWLLDHDLMPK